jgi:hypothetical protein
MTNIASQLGRRHLFTICAVLAALVYLSLVVIANPRGAVLSLLSDDAFYYFKIAGHITAGDGCTFDGIAPTNGFHPMWMLIVVFVFWVAGTSLITPALVVIVLNLLICVAFFVLLYRLVDRYIAPGYGLVAAAACLLPNILTGMLNGLETGLMIFMVVVLVRLVYTRNILALSSSRSSAFGLGILLGVIMLCRLDAVFLFLAVVVMTVISILVRRPPLNGAAARVALICAGFGVAVAPYFIWNFAGFGHLSPISGTVKSTFPALSDRAFDLGGDKRFGTLMLTAIGVLFASVFVADFSRGRNWKIVLDSPLTLLTLACVMHFANTILFLEWGVYWWHYALYGMTLSLALARFAHRFTARRAWTRRLALIVLVIPMIVVAVVMHERILRIKGWQHRGWLEGAEWARNHTPPGTVLACVDAGLIGYFSERPVINLDGKANGYEYLRYLRDGDVDAYLAAHNTAYIINVRGRYYDGFQRVTMPRTKQQYTYVLVSEENEVFRSSEIPSHIGRIREAAKTNLYIWKYEPYLTEPPE